MAAAGYLAYKADSRAEAATQGNVEDVGRVLGELLNQTLPQESSK